MNSLENKIHEDDTHIREWVKENVLKNVTNVKFYEERYSIMDGEYINKKGEYRQIEIKNRHFKHDEYTSTLIEEDKWQYMDKNNNCTLLILFDDGILFYSPYNLRKNVIAGEPQIKYCPTQYNPNTNKWKNINKECRLFLIDETLFFPYEQFNSKPSREIKKSKYYE